MRSSTATPKPTASPTSIHASPLLLPVILPILAMSSSLVMTMPAQAAQKSDIETAGDVLMIAIPAVAYGSTYYMDDKVGRQQFYQSFAANAVATYGVKSIVDKERPDGSDNDSFPSGHTSIAFQGAGFIHKRYGFKYSVPAYVGAAFVGYSRIEADKHDTADVLAGAALGVASSMYFTHEYGDNTVIQASLSPDYYGISAHYQF